MESLVDVARRVLARHPCSALPYGELHGLVRLALPGPAPDPDVLLRRIRTRPELFRVVEAWKGPWRRLLGGEDGDPEAYRSALADAGLPDEPWIVARSPESLRSGKGDWGPLLRASLLLLSRRVDPGSVRGLARWLLLLREERALLEGAEGLAGGPPSGNPPAPDRAVRGAFV